LKPNQNTGGKRFLESEPLKKRAMELKNPPSKSDPSGSYTGVPLNRHEKPVQDADDL
jgi:hypothetical protein